MQQGAANLVLGTLAHSLDTFADITDGQLKSAFKSQVSYGAQNVANFSIVKATATVEGLTGDSQHPVSDMIAAANFVGNKLDPAAGDRGAAAGPGTEFVLMLAAPLGVEAAAGKFAAAPVEGGVIRLLASPSTAQFRLVHLTDDAGKLGIMATEQIMGRSGIFAVPESTAGLPTPLKSLMAGLPPSRVANGVAIPEAAESLFLIVRPIGPYSGIKALGGVRYAAPGVLNLATGELSVQGSILVPQALVYGPDGLVYVIVGGTAVAYWYASSASNVQGD